MTTPHQHNDQRRNNGTRWHRSQAASYQLYFNNPSNVPKKGARSTAENKCGWSGSVVVVTISVNEDTPTLSGTPTYLHPRCCGRAPGCW